MLSFKAGRDIAPQAVAVVEAAVAAGYIDGSPDGSFEPLGRTMA